jgi:hypothetical protein
MAVVLPMASVQRYVCTISMNFSGNVKNCPMKGSDCCGGQNQEVPECMVKVQLLPDAENPHVDQIPFFRAEEVNFLRLTIVDLRSIDAFPVRSERHRAPPDPLEWYIKQQRLLI